LKSLQGRFTGYCLEVKAALECFSNVMQAQNLMF